MNPKLPSRSHALHSAKRSYRSVRNSPVARRVAQPFLAEAHTREPLDPPPHLDDRAIAMATMERLTERATKALRPARYADPLPHPLVTEHTLGHYLQQATATNATLASAVPVGARPALFPLVAGQTALGQALIHCLHQLDHRIQQQDLRITELEAGLAEANRRLGQLEGDRR